MNRFAKQIDMFESNFANPHGLSNPNNFSTASDLAKLCQHAMKKPLFRRIVQTRKHSYTL
jgi:D-alanyl-D-alanine carboxypeptidase/D-alanyl-D-alanine carboxypeptidase (penicillin-binding protein 5/6)